MQTIQRVGLACGLLAAVIAFTMVAIRYHETSIIDWRRIAQATSMLGATIFFFVLWPREL